MFAVGFEKVAVSREYKWNKLFNGLVHRTGERKSAFTAAVKKDLLQHGADFNRELAHTVNKKTKGNPAAASKAISELNAKVREHVHKKF